MAKQIFVITQEGCGGCADMKRRHPELTYIDVTDPKIKNLADRLGLEFTPAIVEVDGNRICLLDDNLRKNRCVRISV